MSQQGREDYQYIIVCLANGDRTETGRCLQRAYQLWQSLTPSQMYDANEHVRRYLDVWAMKDLYESVMHGFETWDQIQTENGAVGWSIKDSQLMDVCKYFGDNIFRLLPALEKVWCDIKVFQRTDGGLEEEGGSAHEKSSSSDGERVESPLKSRLEEGMSKCDLREEYRRATGFADAYEDLKPQGSSRNDDDDSSSSFSWQAPRYEPLEDTEASQLITVDSVDSLEDLSLGDEARHLRNLQIDNSHDTDFEKQISPLLTDEESLKDEELEK